MMMMMMMMMCVVVVVVVGGGGSDDDGLFYSALTHQASNVRLQEKSTSRQQRQIKGGGRIQIK